MPATRCDFAANSSEPRKPLRLLLVVQVNTGSQQRSERGLRNEVDKDGKALKKKREHTIYTPDGGERIAAVLSALVPEYPNRQ